MLHSNEELVTGFLNHKKLSRETIKTYTKVLESFASFFGKGYTEISTKDVEKYLIHIKKHYELTTQAKNLIILKGFYEYLAAKGYTNPFEKVIPPKRNAEYIDINRIPEDQEINKLINVAKRNQRDLCILLLLSTSRLMPHEVTNLKYGDFFRDINGKLGAEVLSRGGNTRIVAIREDVFGEIIKYRVACGMSENIDKSDYDKPVFKNISNLRKIIYSLCKKAGIERKMSPKDLAHYCIIKGLENDATEDQAVNQAGFKSKAVLKKYARAVPILNDPMCNKINLF